MSFVGKIKRAKLLTRERGIGWLAVSVLGELPVLPKVFSKLAGLSVPAGPFVALAGVHSNQLWHERRASIERVARNFLNKPSDVLEIGSWMGKGSTQIWFGVLQKDSSLMLVDSWRPYIAKNETAKSISGMDNLHHVAISSTLKQVYRNDDRLNVTVVRASSKTFLPLLNEKSFDLIYIDGSHYYADALDDMREAKRLLRPGGLICGDDLDMMPRADLIEIARANKDKDLVVLPDGTGFHPGVMLAVAEEFQDINCENGFWWITPGAEARAA